MKLEQRTTMLIVIFSHTYILAIFCFHTKTYCHKIRTHFVYQISIYSPSALTPSQPASHTIALTLATIFFILAHMCWLSLYLGNGICCVSVCLCSCIPLRMRAIRHRILCVMLFATRALIGCHLTQ